MEHESSRSTPSLEQLRNERKKVEMRFAYIKTHHGFVHMRGSSGARDEFHLAAVVQNFKSLASFRGRQDYWCSHSKG